MPPLNGSGTYAAPASSWNPAVTTTTISATDWAALLADITTALSTALYKDGQSTPTANIPLGGFKLTGLGLGTAVTDAPRVSQVQNGSFTSLTAVAGTNTITATATPTPAAYVVGQVFTGIAANSNTGATTANISSLGAGAVQLAGAALVGNEIVANAPFSLYVSAVTPVFQLITNSFSPPFTDTNALVKGSVDATKKIRFEVDTVTTATTRVLTVQDKDITVLGQEDVATQANQETGTSTTTFVSPGRQQFHPSAAKVVAEFDAAATLLASFNVTSITDVGSGAAAVNITTAFSSSNYASIVSVSQAGLCRVPMLDSGATQNASTINVTNRDTANAAQDPNRWSVAAFGDQ